MSVRRAVLLAAMTLPILVWMACGQVYRPVVIPCSTGGVPGCPVESNPQPSNFHTVFGITTNSPNYPGGAMQIDVAGDSIIGETPTSNPSQPNLGDVPTHAVIATTDARVFVASAGSVVPGGVDVVSYFIPVFQTTTSSGLGPVGTIVLPSLPEQTAVITALSEVGGVVTATLASPLFASPSRPDLVRVGTPIVISGETAGGFGGYDGTFTVGAIAVGLNNTATLVFNDPVTGLPPCQPNGLTLIPPIPPCPAAGSASIPSEPDYLASTESSAMYVANFNSNSVAKINTTSSVVTNFGTVELPASLPLGAAPNPVSMAETPTTTATPKLYVANQGNNTVSSFNTIDLSANVVTGFTGIAPVWVVARNDGQKVYVLTQGDGQLVTIDVTTDTVTSSLPVGAGANFIFFDPYLNRLYVTNPVTGMVYVFADTGGLVNGVASDIPVQVAAIDMTAGGSSAPCAAACMPVSVTALADGTRFYVASYQQTPGCAAGGTGSCTITPILTVFNANTLGLEYPSSPNVTLLSPNSTTFTAGQTTVPGVTACAPPVAPALYTPGATRFRVFTVSSVDSSRVYMSMCDAGAVAVINTTDSNANNPGTTIAPDSLVIDLLAGYSGSGAVQSNGEPAPQNPIFLFDGQ